MKSLDNIKCEKCGKNARDLYGGVEYDWLCWDCVVENQLGRNDPERLKKQVQYLTQTLRSIRYRAAGGDKPAWKRMNEIHELAHTAFERITEEDRQAGKNEKTAVRDILLHALFNLSMLEKDAIIYTLNTIATNKTYAEVKEVYDDIYETLTHGT